MENRIPADIIEYGPQNLSSFVGSCFFESFVGIRFPTTVPIAGGSVKRRFYDEPTVIAASRVENFPNAARTFAHCIY